MEKATTIFAGGCFWCVEHDLREVSGVIDAISGYAGKTEAVEVYYDPAKTSFKKLCQFFLDHIDPTDSGGQFFDRGESYATAIFYKNDDEKNIAQNLIQELEESKIYAEPIAVRVLPEPAFYKAEEYHQKYAEKNPDHYEAYRRGSGRAEFVGKTCAVRDEKKIVWKD
ncbi:MAG: peptide-methionine (S)-S-oxide reductase [Patescibacteria group bacterium]